MEPLFSSEDQRNDYRQYVDTIKRSRVAVAEGNRVTKSFNALCLVTFVVGSCYALNLPIPNIERWFALATVMTVLVGFSFIGLGFRAIGLQLVILDRLVCTLFMPPTKGSGSESADSAS